VPKSQSIGGVGLAPIGIILDNLLESAYGLQTSYRAPTSFTPGTHEASMSFRAHFLSDIPCYAAEFPVFARNRELMSNVLTCHAISRSGSLKKGKSGTILQIPC
jgi:hypothetical protein